MPMKTTYSFQSVRRPVPNRKLLHRAMKDAAALAGLPIEGDWEFKIWFLDDEAMAERIAELLEHPPAPADRENIACYDSRAIVKTLFGLYGI